ncbi:hypothetical protein BC835DRAFT_1522848 [Cytidiella melzeri]|nr:hypothetical protein BC835DRAFT_1522848 [Cytidiella melzeri]
MAKKKLTPNLTLHAPTSTTAGDEALNKGKKAQGAAGKGKNGIETPNVEKGTDAKIAVKYGLLWFSRCRQAQTEKYDSWSKDTMLTDKLISSILDNTEIKSCLYSSVGGNVSTSCGGGKTKSEHHWQLAILVFGDHPDYEKLITSAKADPKQRSAWATKVKNRLSSLESTYAMHMESMGETGAGINREDEIDMTMDNKFVNKWEKIKQEFPWLWDMKELVKERPNRVRKGLGNGDTEIDLNVIMPGAEHDGREESTGNITSQSASCYDFEMSSSDEEEEEQHGASSVVPLKCRTEDAPDDSDAEKATKPQVKSTKRTPGRPSTSVATPAKSSPTAAKRFKGVDALNELGVAAEVTAQRQLEVKKAKIEADKDLQKAKLKAKLAAVEARERQRTLAMQHEHEMQMMKMRLKYEREQKSGHGPPMFASAPDQLQFNASGPSSFSVDAGPTDHFSRSDSEFSREGSKFPDGVSHMYNTNGAHDSGF